MKVVRWAAVAVTALFAVLNLGAALDSEQDTWINVGGGVLAVVGVVAVVAAVTGKSWAKAAVVGAGALNVLGAVIALAADQEGGAVGLVVGGLGVLLGVLMRDEGSTRPAVA